MKKVSLKKRKFGLKDFARFIWLILNHYFFFYIYFAIVFAIHFATVSGGFEFANLKPFMFYAGFVGPGVNALLHGIYAEKGKPLIRMVMWAHTFLIIILVPITEFI